MTSPGPASSTVAAEGKPSRPSSRTLGREADHADHLSVDGPVDGHADGHAEDNKAVDGATVDSSGTSKPSPAPASRALSVTSSPAPPSSTPRLTLPDKGKGKAVETPPKPNLFTTASDVSSSFAMRGKLDPRSTAFTPLRHLETSTAPAVDQRDGPSRSAGVGSAVEADPLHRPTRPRHSFSSSTSTGISTPASQFSFTPNTPSSALTWTSTPFSSVYTPHSSSSDLIGRSGLDNFGTKSEAAQEEYGRFLMISNVPPYGNGEQIRHIVQSIAPFRAIIVKHLKTKGCVIVAFHDSRDAVKVAERLSMSKIRFSSGELVELKCANIAPETVRQIAGTGVEPEDIWDASESTIKLDVHSPHGVLVDGMHKCLIAIGDLKSFDVFDPVGKYEPVGKSFAADYYDTRHAAEAIRILNGQPVDGGSLTVRYLSEDPFQSVPAGGYRQQSSLPYTLGSAAYGSPTSPGLYSNSPFDRNRLGNFNALELSSGTAHSGLETSFDRMSLQREGYEPASRAWRLPSLNAEVDAFRSPQDGPLALSRQMSEPAALQGMLNHIDMAARARQQRPVGGHWNQPVDRQAIPPENRVYPERIAAGLDTRTTVMIKDVPNKLSRQELIAILNEVVPGEFDFVYLRFDFNNHCNVGYAFVNFTSCKALLRFIHARVGKKWNMFSSEKVLQVSYANIQGKAALVNKFRNSAVMDVIEEWRPQIFYSSGALKGQPEPFPEADNPAIRHRSTSARLSFLSGNAGDNERSDYDYSGASPYSF